MTDAGVVTVATRPFAATVGFGLGVGAVTGVTESDADATGASETGAGETSALLAAGFGLPLIVDTVGLGPIVESDAVVLQT
jgi:hypothetical protein